MSSLRYRYQTLEFGSTDIHVRSLRDNQEFSDPVGAAEQLGISSAFWPLFGIIWPSGQVLAKVMSDYDCTDKRVLEVGCGLGLASLLLNHRQVNITATDYHPDAELFLQKNTQLNADKDIPFVRTGWADSLSDLGSFDIIIGSDLLYEREQSILLAAFINQHSKPHCEIILIDPGRGHHAHFSKQMQSLGYSHSQSLAPASMQLEAIFSGQILRYSR
jgi:ETFB lysine methyltransferase